MNKEVLRKKYFNIRRDIGILNKSKHDKEIFKKTTNLEEYLGSCLVLTYVSLNDEVDTKELIEYSLKIGKKVAVPKCIGKEMKFYLINSLSELKKGYFRILEPTNENIVKDFKNSICIIPGVCFDNEGNRIGYGARLL